MGFCSTIARVGAIAASYISMWIAEQFGKVFMIIPFGILAVSAAVMTLIFLPETMGKPLPEGIEEIEGTSGPHEMEPLSKSTEETA
uniref:MFS domain-containing protein n=1 Tax=Caenorhabditis japonica TaxID=281687 RepID=A0A8R1ERI9_CAEJA